MTTDTAGTIPGSKLINASIVKIEGREMQIGFGGNDGVSFPSDSIIKFRIFYVYDGTNGDLNNGEVKEISSQRAELYDSSGSISGTLSAFYNYDSNEFVATFNVDNGNVALYAKLIFNVVSSPGAGMQYYLLITGNADLRIPSFSGPSSTFILPNAGGTRRIHISSFSMTGSTLVLHVSISNSDGSVFSQQGNVDLCKINVIDAETNNCEVGTINYIRLVGDNSIISGSSLANTTPPGGISYDPNTKVVKTNSAFETINDCICLRFKAVIDLPRPGMATTPIVSLPDLQN